MEKNLLMKMKYRYLIFLLRNHNNIAFDLDRTLIGKNRYKFLFRKYIIDFPSKKYMLITFRDRFYSHRIEFDMMKENCYHLINLFDKIVECPYTYREQQMKTNEKKLKEWKGFECHKKGYSVIIDDDVERVKEGAMKYNIVFIDSKKIKRVI